LNRFQPKLAKASIFQRKACAYLVTRSTRSRPELPSEASKPKEYAMNIYHGLLFSRGHVTDPATAMLLARSLAAYEPARIPLRKQAEPPGRLRWFFEELVLLSGRPVSQQHLDDLDEPFPPLHPCP
jgi:hypothetical protein